MVVSASGRPTCCTQIKNGPMASLSVLGDLDRSLQPQGSTGLSQGSGFREPRAWSGQEPRYCGEQGQSGGGFPSSPANLQPFPLALCLSFLLLQAGPELFDPMAVSWAMPQAVLDKRTLLAWLRRVGWGVLAGCLGGTLIAASARIWWLGEIACSFRWHLGMTCLVPVGMLGLTRAWRSALVATLLVAYNLGPVVLLLLPNQRRGTASEGLVLAGFNLGGRMDQGSLRGWLSQEDPDILVLLELTPKHLQMVEQLSPALPHSVRWPAEGEDQPRRHGMAVLSRWPIERSEVITGEGWPRPILRASLVLGEKEVTLLAVHPERAGRQGRLARRDSYLDHVSQIAAIAESTIVVGDLNVTGYSPVFSDLLRKGRLSDSRSGFGRQPTWRTDRLVRGLWLALDHVLVGNGFAVQQRQAGPDLGSDHLPVVARLAFVEGG